ncbi:MAG: hypothetical protein FWE18_00820 [Alphaproteobacteria bacterium]|nr:hypothetical protein [Alphaproteobacteria bacterium]
MKLHKNLLIILLLLLSQQLFAADVLSYKDIASSNFDRPGIDFQICFNNNFEKIKENQAQRIKFFKNLKSLCNPKNINDKKYIIKSCIVNGYLMELKNANKSHNLEESIEYAQAQIITDCDSYLHEVIPKLSEAEKKELNALISKATLLSKQKSWIK